MKIHEYQASQIFKDGGLPIVEGKTTDQLSEAVAFAKEVGYPVVLKAQVLVGGRGKAGGVKVVADEGELTSEFNRILGMDIKGYNVEQIYVVRAIDILKEYYLAVTVDSAKGDVVLIASDEGGVEIEEVAKTNPDAIKKCYLNGKKEIDNQSCENFVKQFVSEEKDIEQVLNIVKKLVAVFFEKDCGLAEINPLVIDGKTGQWYAADAKVNFDDNALYRQPELESLRDIKYEDEDEMEAKKHGLSFVKMDGNVGCIVNGAGLAMATMDIVKLAGGNPANFLDVGGSSNPEKVLNALKIILKNKDVKSILINIFGGITRCDDIANGILEAKSQLEIPVPLVVRLTGTNEKEAKEILAKENMNVFSTMREAVERVVELSK